MIQEGGGRDKHISGYSGHQVKEPGDARVRDIRLRAGIQRVRGSEPVRRGGHERRLMRPVGGEPVPKDHGDGQRDDKRGGAPESGDRRLYRKGPPFPQTV